MRLKNIIILFFICFSDFRLVGAQLITSEIKESNGNLDLITNDMNRVKVHIVKEGDTLSSISELYSIDKQFIIEANNLENENYIYIGQNLKITDHNETIIEQNFHEVKKGDSLTEISIIYGISIKDLIEINNLDNPNSLKVGSKLILNKNYSEINEIEILNDLESLIYGPLQINPDSLIIKKNKRLLNAIHSNGKELIVALQCENNQIDVRKKGHKWQGWEEAEKDFEIRLLKDYC